MRRLLLALLAPRAARGGFFGGPTIDGGVYSYDGKGKPFVPADAFADGDAFNSISLTNWDMAGVSNLTIPATVQTLLINSCKLGAVPAEIDGFANLQSLNLAVNKITTVDAKFGAGNTKLTVLNVSQNAITEFDPVIPSLQVLDLTGNSLKGVPKGIFQMTGLTSLYLARNLFKFDSITETEFDFFAGLSDFQADFVQVSACADGSELVNLKGSKVCRLKDQTTSVPIVIVRTETPSPADAAPSPADADASAVVAPLPVTPASVSDGTAKENPTKFIAYGAIFALFALGCAAALYVYIQRRHTSRLRGALHEETPLFFDSDKRTTYHQELAAGDKLFPSNDPVLVTWRLDYDSIKLIRRLAKGAYGEVWIGRYRGTKVAVKKLLEEHNKYEASEDFIKEIKLMAWLQHPKIVEFIGVAWTRLIDMMAVNEFMDNGDLRSYLDTHRSLKWSSPKLQIALDTIDAITYLHSLSPVIIHRDLKSRNILVDSRKGAKLGDFGISATKRERDMTVGVGTTRWLAPELARGDAQYAEAVDVYAFGVILSELDTHELPFFDAKTAAGDSLSDFAILQGVASGKLHVSFSPKCPENLLLLAERCLAFDPKERPSAAEVAYELRRKDVLLGSSIQSSGGLV